VGAADDSGTMEESIEIDDRVAGEGSTTLLAGEIAAGRTFCSIRRLD